MRLKVNYEIDRDDWRPREEIKREVINHIANENLVGMLKPMQFDGRSLLKADFYIITYEQAVELMESLDYRQSVKVKEILSREITELNVPQI